MKIGAQRLVGDGQGAGSRRDIGARVGASYRGRTRWDSAIELGLGSKIGLGLGLELGLGLGLGFREP